MDISKKYIYIIDYLLGAKIYIKCISFWSGLIYDDVKSFVEVDIENNSCI